MASWLTTLGGLGVGGAVGSLLSQYLGAVTGRRTVRANALVALGEVETLRWVDSPATSDSDTFYRATRELQRATLIARVPRASVDQYLVAAAMAFTDSNSNYHRDVDMGNPEPFGSVQAEVLDIVERSAINLVNTIWRPTLSRVWRRHRRKQIQGLNARLDESARRLRRRAEAWIGLVPGNR